MNSKNQAVETNNQNPFKFKFPNEILPGDVIDLFEPVFGEYRNLPESGHTFINGARGAGKSMMFRYMQPDCQILVDSEGNKLTKHRTIRDLDYFAIYIPIRNGQYNKTDILFSNNHGGTIINEHYMVLLISIQAFYEISKSSFDESFLDSTIITNFYYNVIVKCFEYSGHKMPNITKIESLEGLFSILMNELKSLSSNFQNDYINKLALSGAHDYNGPLFSYTDFLLPLLKEFKNLEIMPKVPIYLLIDDADELNLTQRKILNSWVAQRSTHIISLKISTQLKYNNFSTINGTRIDTPHDYSTIYINDIYTTKKNLYYKRLLEIVRRRLTKYGFENTDPEVFFPVDNEQKKKIDKIILGYKVDPTKQQLTKEQLYFYNYRYAEPEFIKQLGGNRSTFSYSGFKQLANISSGIVREFIDFASEMYNAQLSENNNSSPVKFISPKIQNEIIRKCSSNKIDTMFDLQRDELPPESKSDMDKLRNLITGMGGLFSKILLSGASERRVFSIAIQDEPDDELRRIIDLGFQFGYFQKSSIGNKYGTGRVRLLILSRLLAPYFTILPTSFAGYKFLYSADIKIAIKDPKAFIDKFIKEADNDLSSQLDLFKDYHGTEQFYDF